MQAFVILSKDGSFAVAISPKTISLTIDGVHSFIFRDGAIVDSVLSETKRVHLTDAAEPVACPGCRRFIHYPAVQS